MQKLMMNHFGPITSCDIEIKDYMIFTGAQATGKSTIAKSIFFFNDIKNLLLKIVQREYFSRSDGDTMELPLGNRLIREIRSTFLQIFGTTMAMDPQMQIRFRYDDGESITISLEDRGLQHNYAVITISEGLWDAVSAFQRDLEANAFDEISKCKAYIEREIFHNDLEIVYIPAGRSLITLLSSQINYLYSTMDDMQKRSIDYCTQNYLERILKLKQFFVTGYEQLIGFYKSTTDKRVDQDVLTDAQELISGILKGEYQNIDGEERLQISREHYVKINFASSGQQEAVWILNVLFYYMLNNKKACFVIEEPESHLFPNAQKLITEYISLAKNHNNRMVITTHSPYVLGSVNNLLYAHHIEEQVPAEELDRLVRNSCRISFDRLGAYYLQGGALEDCTDPVFESIRNEVIDGASEEINDLFEEMVLLKEKYAG